MKENVSNFHVLLTIHEITFQFMNNNGLRTLPLLINTKQENTIFLIQAGYVSSLHTATAFQSSSKPEPIMLQFYLRIILKIMPA